MLRKVVFEYDGLIIEARVHLGTTSARGDDPDEVISLLATTGEDCYVYVDGPDWTRLAELAILEARSEVAV